MSYAIQCCVMCQRLEQGHTEPGDCYLCVECSRDEAAEAGWYRALARGEICTGCDCPKKKEAAFCEICAPKS